MIWTWSGESGVLIEIEFDIRTPNECLLIREMRRVIRVETTLDREK
jgi:hypothetical protein